MRQFYTDLMSCMLPYEGLLLGVPEANAAVVGAADADVALALVLAEGKA